MLINLCKAIGTIIHAQVMRIRLRHSADMHSKSGWHNHCQGMQESERNKHFQGVVVHCATEDDKGSIRLETTRGAQAHLAQDIKKKNLGCFFVDRQPSYTKHQKP